MTTLTGITPTPTQLADAIRDRFADTIRDAAGADGRLTRNEAEKIAERADPEWIVSDNAVNFLKFTGQKTVSANKLIGKIHEYAEAQASAQAGANQRLSLLEARALPADLQAEFFYLRGKGLPERVQPQDLEAAVRDMVQTALDTEDMTRLDTAPWQVMGEDPIIESLQHPASHTRAIVYVADGEVYLSRAAPAGPGQHLVGWYHVGAAPDVEPS